MASMESMKAFTKDQLIRLIDWSFADDDPIQASAIASLYSDYAEDYAVDPDTNLLVRVNSNDKLNDLLSYIDSTDNKDIDQILYDLLS